MKRIILLVIAVLLITGNTEAGWKEDLKKATKKTKEATKKTTQGIKKATKKTKKRWDKRESPCTRCGKPTKLGKWCAECKKKAAMNTGREIGKRGKKAYNITKKGAQKASKFTSEKYKKWSPIVESKYKETLNNIRDPEKRAKAKGALIKTAKIASQIQQAKKKGVYFGISKATSIRLPGELGGKTIGEEMGERLIKICPELAGMGIEDDPAMALTAAVCFDRKFLTHNLKFIKRDGRNVSLAESVKMSSSFNSSGAIKGLKAIAATERLATGEGDIGDLIKLGNTMNSVNK